jgi:hypothetical protein
MKAVLELPNPHDEVLILLLDLIPPKEYKWALTGSCSLRLQGVDIPVNDLDLQIDGESVNEIEMKLAEFMQVAVHPWESEHTYSLHGKAEITGVTVELLGGIKHRPPGREWEPSVEILSTRIWVLWRERQVPVFPLEFEAQAYEKMGRVEKANLIREAIRV